MMDRLRGAITMKLYLEHTCVSVLGSKFEIHMPNLKVVNVH